MGAHRRETTSAPGGGEGLPRGGDAKTELEWVKDGEGLASQRNRELTGEKEA